MKTILLLLLMCTLSAFTFSPEIVNVNFPHGTHRDTTRNYIVIHNDSSNASPKGIMNWLKKKKNAYHFLIDKNGKIYRLVDPSFEANHAGVSLWDGLTHMNKYSIGICLQNNGREKYTEKQYQSLEWLINAEKHRFPDIVDSRIIGHQDVAMPRGRKNDPGYLFDWNRIKPPIMALNYDDSPKLTLGDTL